jgi:hypothetical protein
MAAIQVSEALKYLHGQQVQPDIVCFNGHSNTTHHVRRSPRDDCPSHTRFSPLIECSELSSQSTVRDVLDTASKYVSGNLMLELDRQILLTLDCLLCRGSRTVLRPIRRVSESMLECPTCKVRTRPRSAYKFGREDQFAGAKLCELGLPALHIVRAAGPGGEVYLEMSGDAERLFDREKWN